VIRVNRELRVSALPDDRTGQPAPAPVAGSAHATVDFAAVHSVSQEVIQLVDPAPVLTNEQLRLRLLGRWSSETPTPSQRPTGTKFSLISADQLPRSASRSRTRAPVRSTALR
jgi:hypothetical protein